MIICIVIKGSIGLWVKGRGGYADNRLAEPNNSSSSVVDWFCLRAISTNQKPTIYRNLYENTGPGCHDLPTES